MVSLYKLTDQQRELKAMAEKEDADPEQFNDTFLALSGQFNDKAINIIHVAHEYDSDIECIDAEIKRLTARKNTAKNRKESLREYLRTNMEANKITKIECPLFTITLAKGKDVCFIEDADKIPDEFMDIKVVESPLKAAILKKLKAGEVVLGARIEKSKTSLRIK